MTLKRGTAKVKTITVKLSSKGVAKGVFKSVTKKGKYKIVTVFAGSAGLKGSTGTSDHLHGLTFLGLHAQHDGPGDLVAGAFGVPEGRDARQRADRDSVTVRDATAA